MPIIAVYRHPLDFPEECVARIYDLDKATDTIMVKQTVQEIMEDVRKHTNMMFVPRSKEDASSVVGSWI